MRTLMGSEVEITLMGSEVEIKHITKILALLLLVIAIVVHLETATYPTGTSGDPGAAFFPRLLMYIVAVLALYVLGKDFLLGEGEGIRFGRAHLVRVAVPLALSTGLLLLAPILGFHYAAIAMLIVFFYFSGVDPVPSVVLAIVSATVVYYIFGTILSVPLPEGPFPQIL